jgi:hypothetical protein
MAPAPAEIAEMTRPAISRPDIVTTSVTIDRETEVLCKEEKVYRDTEDKGRLKMDMRSFLIYLLEDRFNHLIDEVNTCIPP